MRTALLVVAIIALSLTSAHADMTDPQVQAAMSARVGHPVHDLGIVRIEGFPHVVVVGFFANDRGYRVEGVFVGDEYASIETQTPKALAAAGWAGAPPAKRQQLALQWTESALLAWQSPLSQAPKRFGDRSFQKPTATALPGDGVQVTLWVQKPAGMRPVFRFEKMVYAYSPQGALRTQRVQETFETSVHD